MTVAEGVGSVYTIHALILPGGTYFIGDTHVNVEPSAEQVAEATGAALIV